MKKLYTIILAVLFAVPLFAQVPGKMSYQAVVRDNSNSLIINSMIGLRISILQNSVAVYEETQTPVTNDNGLISIEIGGGEGFNVINWADGPIFIKTEIDPSGGKDYSVTGVSQMLTVPYALHALTASYLTEDNGDGDGFKAGIPSQAWSLFGNSNSNADKDKLGTSDYVDLVFVTDDLDRLRIKANGDINIANSLSIGKDLNVNQNVNLNILGGQTINNGDLTVANGSSTLLTGTLTVDLATDLNSNLNVDGTTDLNGSLDVNNAAPTNLTGTLNVDGATDLNSSLTVNNAAPTHLTGSLDVDLNLNVDGAVDLNNTLNVDGATTLINTLNVGGATTINNTTGLNGQVTIDASVAGGDASYGAFPLRVQGSDQGIAIKLNAGTPNNDNNFITFFNSSGDPVGGIEGETQAERAATPEFIYEETIVIAEEALAVANVVLSIIPIVVGGLIASTGPCIPCITIAAADLVLATANLIAFNAFAFINLGVTYSSGSADYAEWLERSDPNEKISAGDIVGVYGGKISKYTHKAQQYMVISTKPAILGNMPTADKEYLYEKVAFMGQIPVKVRGMVLSGDYILPSGLNDGTGIAVSPADMKAEQYREIVGIAWTIGINMDGISMINMAIGLNTNDVADLAVKQEKKIQDLTNQFNTLEGRLLALENGTTYTPANVAAVNQPVQTKTIAGNVMTRAEMIASNVPAELSDEVMDSALQYLEKSFKDRGLILKDHPGLNRLFTDAAYQAEIIKKTQENYKISYQNILIESQN